MGRAIVVGSGSAGRRHAKALRVADRSMCVTVVRRPSSTPAPAELEELGIEVTHTLSAALEHRPDVVVIASPAPMHLANAEALVPVASAVLVEKPLAHDLPTATAIARLAERHVRPVVVGYHLRFGDVLPELRRLVGGGVIGTPSGFHLDVGQHLSQWRPGVDPRDTVSARTELGGGVLLELSHELDSLRFVLGTDVTEVSSARTGTEGAPTDGRVETTADLEVVTSADARGSVHLDMTSPVPVRRWTFTGTDATLSADLLSGTIQLIRAGQDPLTLVSVEAGERDRAESRLIQHLLEVAGANAHPLCTTADGVAAVAIVDAARSSAATGAAVAVRLAESGSR